MKNAENYLRNKCYICYIGKEHALGKKELHMIRITNEAKSDCKGFFEMCRTKTSGENWFIENRLRKVT